MITHENLRDVLLDIGFDYNKSSDIYYKNYLNDKACEIRVNFKTKKIEYPKNKGFVVNDDTTSNFEHPENFVVLECVNRLFDKGYRPEHIELEKRWNLGHDAKGGKADICVYNKDHSNMLLIIECKTAGSEHKKALKELKEDGGQLFSYWQQERSTQWLSLYASDFVNGHVDFENFIVNCNDDENIKKNKSAKLFEKARTVTDLFDAWNETYEKQILPKGIIFGEESSAYQIGIPPLRKKHLQDFNPDDKIVNRFEEILRHNNVSDKENAFNRLVALFICKLVDEIQKGDDDIVEFQYKVGTDTYESLQDRLQRLHKEGMEKFMGEEIYYIADDYAEKLFENKLNGKNRKAAIEDLRNTIRILKFYSNNDFAFKDVHNEQLFLQNGKILVEVVQLFERYRIVYPSKDQFLGDLFEQLLNKGFKQNEGQFFTPMPITRFIWDCLPLEKVIKQKSGLIFPKIIDYACGAGHFLTEGVEAINCFFQSHGNAKKVEGNNWVEKSLFGIEKDYRLARVAKVSLYMNGAGSGNIKFGDGLESYPSENIENGKFAILVANPPYSVSGFKQHLDLKGNTFSLLDKISNDASEIETLFVERTSQLLKPKGIAAIILPSSILSNDSASYIGAREIILQNFYIRAIVQFGGKTFGATNTNTVVLYLEKFDEPPKKKDLVKDSISAILNGDFSEDWVDDEIFKQYIAKIKVAEEDYKKFALEEYSFDELKNIEYFNQYLEKFNEKNSKFKGDKVKEFYKQVKEIEKDKLTYFALTYNQKTLIISAPTDNNEQKRFLGYDWSNRKGNEGIQIISAGGQLYNDKDRCANDTLSAAVREMFNDQQILLSEDISKYCTYARTQDMLDFSRTEFKKSIKTSVDRVVEIKSKYPLVKLGGEEGACEIKIGGTPARAKPNYFSGNNLWVSISEMNGQIIYNTKEKISNEAVKDSNVKLIKKGTTLLSFKLSIGKTAVAGADLYTNEAIAALEPKDPKKLLNEYLFALFNGKMIDLENVEYKAFGKSLNSSYLKEEVSIPLPPIDIQKAIVKECEAVDKQHEQALQTIESCKQNIEQIIASINGDVQPLKKIAPYTTERIAYEKILPNSYVSTDNLLQNFEGIKDYDGIPNVESVIKYQIGDILVSNIRPYLKKIWQANQNGGCSPDVLVFRPIKSISAKYVFYAMKRQSFFDYVMKDIKGMKMPRGNKGNIENFSIPVPSPTEQFAIVKEIEKLEQQIADAKAQMESTSAQKQAILKKYLE